MMKKRQRLAILLAVALGLSLLLVLAWVLQVMAVIHQTVQTTLEEFNEGTLMYTALSQVDDGEVRLMTIGIAGEWLTDTNTSGWEGQWDHCAVYHDGIIYVIGGQKPGDISMQEIYTSAVDFETHDLGDWSLAATLPEGLAQHGCAIVHDRLYVLGGLDDYYNVKNGVVYAEIEPGGTLGDWEGTEPLPGSRYAAEVVVLDDRIYVIGGVANIGGPQNQVWYAEPDPDTGVISGWQTGEPLPPMSPALPGYYGHAAAAGGGYLYVTGGTNGTAGGDTMSNLAWYAEPTITGTITHFTETAIPMARNLFEHEAVALNGQLFLLGGSTDDLQEASNYVGVGLLGSDGDVAAGWYEDSILVPARFRHAAVVSIDSWIYVLGGSAGLATPLEEGGINSGSVTGEGEHRYADSGTFTSGIMEVDELESRVLSHLSWDATISDTANMSLTMEYRYRPQGEYWYDWEGPFASDATPGRFTTTIPIEGYPMAQLFQYRVSFQTTISNTPILNAVILHFDRPDTPELVKVADPPHETKVEPGDTITYTLSYTNPNATPLTSFVITDYIPVSTTLDLNSIYPPGYVLDDDLEWIAWYSDTLDRYETGQVGFAVQVDEDAPDNLIIWNGAHIDSLEVDLGFSNRTRHPVNAVVYDLEVSKDDGLTAVGPGQIVTYTILYTNTNKFALTLSDLVLTETLSAYPFVSHVAGSGPWAEVSPGIYTVQAGGLGPNASGSLSFVAQISPEIPPDIELFTNTVRIRGECQGAVDIDQENDVAYDVDVILPLTYDLSVTKDDMTTTAEPGDTLFYNITVLNQNGLGLPVGGVVLTETLDPAGYMSYSGGGPWVSVGSGVYRYELPEPVPAGTPLVIPFEVDVAPGLPIQTLLGITNTVEVAAEDFNGVDLNLGNNRFFDIDIVWGPDLAVTDFKLSPSRPVAGEPVMVDVTVVNQGITKTGTTSPHGEGFFFVEVYAKDADFNPDGPPDGPMDHDGGFWGPLPEGGWGWRTEYINYYSPVAGLEPGEETVVSLIITPTATSPYDFYAQVDVTFDVPISTTHPYGYPWGIHEEGNEYNNIAMYQERDIPPVYLPAVMRN